MKRTTLLKTLFLRAVISSSTNLFSSEQEPIRMELRVDKKGTAISPTMYGLFFEDINFAADGGLYAEMIKNRSFDFKHPFTGWNVFGDVVLMNDENSPFINNPNYIRLNSSGHRHKHTGVENEIGRAHV